MSTRISGGGTGFVRGAGGGEEGTRAKARRADALIKRTAIAAVRSVKRAFKGTDSFSASPTERHKGTVKFAKSVAKGTKGL